jgi:amino acid transporter
MFPTIFARVHPKYHSPTWSLHLVAVAWIIAIFLTWTNPWFLAMICFTGVFWRYFFYSLSAVVLPYSRPDFFERGFKWRIAGFPVITLVGLIALGLNMWLMFPVFEWILSDPTYIWWTIGWWLWSILMYVVFYNRNVKKGIDMSEIYRTIPPA